MPLPDAGLQEAEDAEYADNAPGLANVDHAIEDSSVSPLAGNPMHDRKGVAAWRQFPEGGLILVVSEAGPDPLVEFGDHRKAVATGW
jgi:hypothetical protein